jgi:hypothetical protein
MTNHELGADLNGKLFHRLAGCELWVVNSLSAYAWANHSIDDGGHKIIILVAPWSASAWTVAMSVEYRGRRSGRILCDVQERDRAQIRVAAIG